MLNAVTSMEVAILHYLSCDTAINGMKAGPSICDLEEVCVILFLLCADRAEMIIYICHTMCSGL